MYGSGHLVNVLPACALRANRMHVDFMCRDGDVVRNKKHILKARITRSLANVSKLLLKQVGQGYPQLKSRREYIPVGSASASLRLTLFNCGYPYPTG